MHVLYFCDQHPTSLGGAQVSVQLQGEFLEAAGGTATWVAPAPRSGSTHDARYIDLPSRALSPFEQYTWVWPSKRHIGIIDDALKSRPPVDVVHVQADFWAASLGYAYARRHGLPVVHTMHNRVDVGIDAVIPFPGLLYAVLGRWQRWALGEAVPRVSDGWSYLAHFARRAARITAPSHHFSRRLESHGVVSPIAPEVITIPNGIDDAVLARVGNAVTHTRDVPTVVWLGRFSAEKRLLDFLRAVRLVAVPCDIRVVGSGMLDAAARRAAPSNVTFVGHVTYEAALTEIASAHVLVQTSNGFETQGMTVMEAVALGTHAVIIDSDIAAELPEGTCSVVGSLTDEDLAAAITRALAIHTPGLRPRSFRTEFAQTARTEQMLRLYSEVVSQG